MYLLLTDRLVNNFERREVIHFTERNDNNYYSRADTHIVRNRITYWVHDVGRTRS